MYITYPQIVQKKVCVRVCARAHNESEQRQMGSNIDDRWM